MDPMGYRVYQRRQGDHVACGDLTLLGCAGAGDMLKNSTKCGTWVWMGERSQTISKMVGVFYVIHIYIYTYIHKWLNYPLHRNIFSCVKQIHDRWCKPNHVTLNLDHKQGMMVHFSLWWGVWSTFTSHCCVFFAPVSLPSRRLDTGKR